MRAWSQGAQPANRGRLPHPQGSESRGRPRLEVPRPHQVPRPHPGL